MAEETDTEHETKNDNTEDNDDTMTEANDTQQEQQFSDDARSLKEELAKIIVEPPQIQV